MRLRMRDCSPLSAILAVNAALMTVVILAYLLDR